MIAGIVLGAGLCVASLRSTGGVDTVEVTRPTGGADQLTRTPDLLRATEGATLTDRATLRIIQGIHRGCQPRDMLWTINL